MENIKELFGKVKNATSELYSNTQNKLSEGDGLTQVVAVIVVSLLVIGLVEFISSIVNRIKNYYKGSPEIVSTTKSAKKRLVISQYKKNAIDKLIRRSRNEWGGIEFTYRLWFFIDDWSYKYGSWKHLFHKGNTDSWPNRAPGVWFHPKKNAMRVYMNTYENIVDYIDIPNIPIQKWVHLTITCIDKKLNIYFNGQLKKQLTLSGIPRQNYGDLYVNSFGGFSGYVSKMVYHDYALPVARLRDIVEDGPSRAPCPGVNITPPYLATNWWQIE